MWLFHADNALVSPLIHNKWTTIIENDGRAETFSSLPPTSRHRQKPLINYLFMFRTPANVDNNRLVENLVFGLRWLGLTHFYGFAVSWRRLITAGRHQCALMIANKFSGYRCVIRELNFSSIRLESPASHRLVLCLFHPNYQNKQRWLDGKSVHTQRHAPGAGALPDIQLLKSF